MQHLLPVVHPTDTDAVLAARNMQYLQIKYSTTARNTETAASNDSIYCRRF